MNTEPTPAPLAADWPDVYAMHVKDEATAFVLAMRGPWPDPAVLLAEAVDRVVDLIDRDLDVNERERDLTDAWLDRWDRGAVGPEIHAAIRHHSRAMTAALEA